MYKTSVCVGILLLLALPNVFAQENQIDNSNWFKRHFGQRMYFGFYDSFGDEKANVLQVGYDAGLNLINVRPKWPLFEFYIGVSVWFVRDQINKETKDNFGHTRTTDNRLIPAFELNWGVRLNYLYIPQIKTSLYLEAAPITFVYYTKPYPDTGTNVNIGTHFGFGMKSQINDTLDGFATLRIFSHTSNGQAEETNPALDMVGLVFGLQFK